MLNPFAAIVATLRLLAARRDGSVAIIFGLAAIPVIIGGGMAIDTARAYVVKTRLGAALDAAALAVGSNTSTDSTVLTTSLQNYFYNNYCKSVPSGTSVTQCSSTVLGETNVTVAPVGDISASVVTYQAQATVPMTFMQLTGINNVSLSVTAQTTKFPGMEIAVVLDNTGSMLCNDAAVSPTYTACGSPAVTSNTACTTLGATPSRICTLIQAANQFVTTLVNAQTGQQQLYMSIVPYVTTVNVGTAFGCTNGSTTCTHITSSGGEFTDQRGYMIPVTLITGDTTTTGTTISNVSMATPGGAVSGTAAVQPGTNIYGPGIPSGATVSSVSGTSIVISATPTLTKTGATLAVGPSSAALVGTPIPTAQIGITGTLTNSNASVTGITPNTTGLSVGMAVSGTGIAAGTKVLTVNSSTQITLSANATASGSKALTIQRVGTVTSGTNTITVMLPNTTGVTGLADIVPGMLISGTGIPAGAYVTAVNSAVQITVSANSTSTGAARTLTFTNQGGNTTNASNSVTSVSAASVPTVGTIVTGNGIPVNTTVTAASSTAAQYLAGTGTLTISNNATATNNTTLHFFTPITYDTAYNSASPAGSSTTASWGGCVIEPTSSGENVAGTGVLAVSGNPDTSEPVSGTSWYPFWWPKSTSNNWATPARQDTTTEIQGSIASYNTLDGPNQGCPVPILPLTDLTTTAGQTAVTSTINSMWSRNSGGTQVHTGMIWGWRALSPNGPFTANNGHPLAYDTAKSTGCGRKSSC
jgi:Flp pilus assembly protein TadG